MRVRRSHPKSRRDKIEFILDDAFPAVVDDVEVVENLLADGRSREEAVERVTELTCKLSEGDDGNVGVLGRDEYAAQLMETLALKAALERLPEDELSERYWTVLRREYPTEGKEEPRDKHSSSKASTSQLDAEDFNEGGYSSTEAATLPETLALDGLSSETIIGLLYKDNTELREELKRSQSTLSKERSARTNEKKGMLYIIFVLCRELYDFNPMMPKQKGINTAASIVSILAEYGVTITEMTVQNRLKDAIASLPPEAKQLLIEEAEQQNSRSAS